MLNHDIEFLQRFATAYLILKDISWMSISIKVEFLSQELVAFRDWKKKGLYIFIKCHNFI